MKEKIDTHSTILNSVYKTKEMKTSKRVQELLIKSNFTPDYV